MREKTFNLKQERKHLYNLYSVQGVPSSLFIKIELQEKEFIDKIKEAIFENDLPNAIKMIDKLSGYKSQ